MFDQQRKESRFDTSLLAIFGGVAVWTLYPDFAIYAILMMAVGAGGFAISAASYSKFDSLFKNLNLGMNNVYPMLKRKTKKESSELYEFTLPRGLSVEDFEEHKAAISQFLGKSITISYGFKNIYIEAFDESKKSVYEYEPEQIDGVGIIVGYDRVGKLITADLSSGEPHLLIAGETGSGKSTVLRSIITNLILVSNCELFLIDLKNGAEFNVFQKCSKVKAFARTRGEAEKMLRQIINEVDRRYNAFYHENCVDIKHYNKDAKIKMPYQVLIIDEFADLMLEKHSVNLIAELAAKARACGIHLIISTQRPDAQVLNGRIKANVTCILGLKTTNDSNSRIIIDHEGLEKLKGKGHGIFKRGKEIEIQCPYLDINRTQELIQYSYIDKEKSFEATKGEITGTFEFLDKLG